MRVAHVVTTDTFSGLERYAVDVAGVLAQRGHDVLVVGGDPVAVPARLPPAVRWAPGATPGETFATLRRAGAVDVVHSHITKADFAAYAAGPWSRAARVSTRHINAARGYTRAARLLARQVRRGLATEIAVSEFTAGQLPEGRPDVVLHNGVADVPAHARGLREHTILIAQRLSPEKDTVVGLRAFARSGLADRGWRLLIAGRGEEMARLELEVDRSGSSTAVELLGWVDDVEELYRTAGVLLATAPGEPFGLSVLEAAAHGMPVLAVAAGGHLETVGALPDACLFPAGDADAAAAQLRRLAADETGRTAYGIRLRDLQRSTFTLERHVDALEGVYRKAAESRTRRA